MGLLDGHAALFETVSDHQQIYFDVGVLPEAEWLHLVVQFVEDEQHIFLLLEDLVFIELSLLEELAVQGGVEALRVGVELSKRVHSVLELTIQS